jgi:hypothetical protein
MTYLEMALLRAKVGTGEESANAETSSSVLEHHR